MIRLDCPQGSVEWIEARLGIPTASQFDKIIAPKTMKFSESAAKYAWALIAEQILRAPVDGASSAFMQRGETLERRAVSYYELNRDVETEPVGVILRDDRRVGCSPDRLVGDDGLLEIKVPNVANHIGYLLDADGIGYRAQVQGNSGSRNANGSTRSRTTPRCRMPLFASAVTRSSSPRWRPL